MAMDRKTWLVEMEVGACFLAVAFVALALMLGDTLWKSVAGKYPKNTYPSLRRRTKQLT
jgi:hypothetical protein